jgi:hypothetical protein
MINNEFFPLKFILNFQQQQQKHHLQNRDQAGQQPQLLPNVGRKQPGRWQHRAREHKWRRQRSRTTAASPHQRRGVGRHPVGPTLGWFCFFFKLLEIAKKSYKKIISKKSYKKITQRIISKNHTKNHIKNYNKKSYKISYKISYKNT